MPTYHETKEDLVRALWQKMKEVGADHALITDVSTQTLELQPGDDDLFEIEAYHKLIEAIVECAWKRGVSDCLHAFEIGAIKNNPSTNAGGNN